jgi:hypothetical protein
MPDLLFLAIYMLAICVASCISSLTSFSGLQCVVLDAAGAVVLASPAVAPGLLPLASPAVEDDATARAPLPAKPPGLLGATPAASRPAVGLQ